MTAIDTVRALYAASAAGDMSVLERLLGDTYWIEARGGPYGGTYQGLSEIGPAVFGAIASDVQDFSVNPDELLAIGSDRVLSLGTYRGHTVAGPLAIRFAHLITVDGERISHVEQFTDTHEWLVATGG
ncbi:nuclear transport factor 2 family protein [Sphingomonas humi]|uniref:Nuclear transport factor 2 family protein n=1 Tax=Sphingomonas humi TaxID=335630 RepID=A0ABP7SCL6_9SPHN